MSNNLNVYIISDKAESFELTANSLKEILSLLKLQKGAEFVKHLMDENYKFVLSDSSNPEKIIALSDVVIFSDFTGYDTLFILKDIEGDEPVSIGTWMAVTLSSWGFGTAAGFVLTNAAIFGSIAMMAVSIGLNMLMSALSPTPEFSQDPAAQQNTSSLFNGAPIIRNQGGSMPLVFGNPYCGAVLISSGAFSEELSA